MPHRTQAIRTPEPPLMPTTVEGLQALSLGELRHLVNVHGGVAVGVPRSKAQAITMLIPLLPPVRPDPSTVKARMADVVIRIMRDANPYRPGSAASDHFDKMQGGITVREYLAKFPEPDRRTARQWLYNAQKAGHVKTLGGDA